MSNIKTVYDLVKHQIKFQEILDNEIPKDIVSFENVQESLSHNNYQNIEFQEFVEAMTREDKQEELIDYLLFLINKYIFLNINLATLNQLDLPIYGTLWTYKSQKSLCNCDNLARLEQNNYISFIRAHCTFKPWKVRKEKSCVDKEQLQTVYFLDALSYFKEMANIVFNSYDEFKDTLNRKLSINIHRQNSGY